MEFFVNQNKASFLGVPLVQLLIIRDKADSEIRKRGGGDVYEAHLHVAVGIGPVPEGGPG